MQSPSISMLPREARERLEADLLEFDQAWKPGLIPEFLAKWVEASPDARRLVAEELVKIDLEYELKAGGKVDIEQYLRQFPMLGDRDTVSVELLQAEYDARRAAGSEIPIAEYERRFPRQAAALRRLIESADDSDDVSTSDTSRAGAVTDTLAGPTTFSEELPARFHRYRVLRKLGQGAMGTVYLAHDTQLDRPVALKTPSFGAHASAEVIDRFYREARAAAGLQHRNICPIYDVGEAESIRFISMAFVEGWPLAQFIRPDKPMSEKTAVILVRKVALALAQAHDRGVIHRDLKPANIMIDTEREPIVMDFGLARRDADSDQANATQSGMLLGTPAYMSPEQVDAQPGAIGPPADIYSLGVILYQLLTGQTPFKGSVAKVIAKIATEEPPRPSQLRPSLSPELEAICLRMINKRVEDRYASMKDVADALTEFLKNRSSDSSEAPAEISRQAVPPPPVTTARETNDVETTTSVPSYEKPPSGRHLGKFALVALALVLLLAVILLLRTPAGTLRIEVNDPNLRVLIDGQQVTLEDQRWQGRQHAGEHTLGLKVGDQQLKLGSTALVRIEDEDARYRLKVAVDGIDLQSDRFVMERGKMTAVTISLEPAISDVSNDWIELFNGRDLTGWEGDTAVWRVENGTIVGHGEQLREGAKSHLLTKRKHTDFELQLEYKLLAAGNSGIVLRGRVDRGRVSGLSVELGLAGRAGDMSGSLWRYNESEPLVPFDAVRQAEVLRENDWNRIEVICQGERITVKLNGLTTANFRDVGGAREGQIGLQVTHGLTIAFRDVRIREPLSQRLKNAVSTARFPAAWHEAVAAGEAIEEVDRTNADWGFLGQAYYHADRFADARHALEKCVELRGEQLPTVRGGPRWWYLIMTLHKLGEKDLARSYYDQLTRQLKELDDPHAVHEHAQFRRNAARTLGLATD